MSSKNDKLVDELSTLIVEKSKRRHPALQRRDALYANSARIPRLTERGNLVVSGVPVATDLLGLRPLTMEEQIARFSGHGIVDWSLVPDLPEDEWLDYADDIDEDGITPHELNAFRNQERYFNRGLKAADKPKVSKPPTPPPSREDASASSTGAAGGTQGVGAGAPAPSASDGK